MVSPQCMHYVINLYRMGGPEQPEVPLPKNLLVIYKRHLEGVTGSTPGFHVQDFYNTP